KPAFNRSFGHVHTEIAEPARRVKSGASNIRTLVADEKENGTLHALRLAFDYLKSGIKKYAYLGKNIADYLLPLTAAVIFVVTVVTVMGKNFALAIQYDGQLVGYVREEVIYENAEKMVKGRIVYTGDDQQSWNMTPTYSIVAAKPAEISDTESLADSILQKSGAEITEAVGLYVDGVFHGATTDSLQLESDLEKIKQPYQVQYPDAEIGFVQNVELKQGIYLTNSVVDYSTLSGLLTSEVQGQRSYVIAKGDTPLMIAGKNDVTLADLYAMNPVLENGKNLPIGQELLISGAQSFLQVKVVITQTVQEEVAFATNKTNDSKLGYGLSKVTQKGVKGLDNVTYTYTYVDGIQTNRTEVGRATIAAPVTEEISIGTYISSAGINVAPGSGALLFPIGPGYKGMSRGFTGAYAHNGLDLRGFVGTPIYAAQSGVVTTAAYGSRGYGIHVVVNHGGMSTLYGHCSALLVSSGQYVEKGQIIARLGSSGNSTGPHCHFEVIVNGVRVNPAGYLGW
ncbi:MAG: M23 family metallopeptidase, partial [Pygmaiobacter sp.]